MSSFFKFFIAVFMTVFIFIGLVNLNILIDHNLNRNDNPADVLNHFIFVKKRKTNIETYKSLNLNNFKIDSMYRLSKNLNLIRKNWCQNNSSICKDLLSYSLARKDWVSSERLAKALCLNFKKCPLASFLQDLRREKIYLKNQLNNFSKKKRLPNLVDRVLKDTNIPISGVICYYAEQVYKLKCQWRDQKLVLDTTKDIKLKVFQECTSKNSVMDCWVDSRLKTKAESNQLTKACTLDSSAACYEMGLSYLKVGHLFLAKKIF